MKEEQRLFLVQARSAYSVFELLSGQKSLHHCHALHYLQMATELLGKASAWQGVSIGKSHKALSRFLDNLATNSKAQKQLGFEGQNANWAHTIRKIKPLANDLQNLAPSLANDGPNPEYPWPTSSPTTAPVEYNFPIWDQLTTTSLGRTLLVFIKYLFDVAEEYL
jgi:hypothetical protein